MSEGSPRAHGGWKALERCPACDGDARLAPLRFVKHDLAIHRCSSCGSVFVNPQPSAELLLERYDADYFQAGGFQRYGYRDYQALVELKRLTFRRWLRDLETFTRRGRLLEVGCATGLMLELASQAGWSAVGVEISEYAATEARRRGHRVHTAALDELEETGFDVVLMLDVLEHVPAPAEMLRSANRLLRPGGVLCAVTPNAGGLSARIQGAGWPHLKPLEHLCLFSKSSLRGLAARCGFETLELTSARKFMTVDRLVADLGETNPRVVRLLETLGRLAPRARAKPFYLPLGEMRLVARKAARDRFAPGPR